MEQKSEGILIDAIPYLGYQKVFKTFTPDQGLITLFAKHRSFQTLVPFCRAEWIYARGRSEMMRLKEISLLDPLLDLRQSYIHLSAAATLAKDLLLSQYAARESHSLYRVFSRYLKKIPEFPRPEILNANFKLKLLAKEGILHLEKECVLCKKPSLAFKRGASVCLTHSFFPDFVFSQNEWDQLYSLLFCQSFSQMRVMDLSDCLLQGIENLFREALAYS